MSGDSDKLAAETAIWLARLERGLRPEEGAQLTAWLRNPAQCEALITGAKLYHGPDIVAILAAMVPVGFGHAAPPVPKRRMHPMIPTLAFTFALCVAFAPLVVVHKTMPGVIDPGNRGPRPNWVPWDGKVFHTQAGETRRVDLPDGSQVTLNGHSEVGVLFSAGSRGANVRYGEAIFRVAAEKYRPFEVNAAGRHIVAPPSKFDVKIVDAQTVELTVFEGDVTVKGLPWRWPATPAEARLFDPQTFKDATLGPMQAAVLQDTTVSRYEVTPAVLHARLSWQPEEVIYVTQ